jgi:uncharacterized damage-inducible protein DinB
MSSTQITPEQARFLFYLVLPTLKTEHQTTKRVIEAIPSDKGDYRPDPAAKSALELAWHIVAAEKRLLGGVHAGAFDFTPIHRPETVRDPADIVRWFDQSFAANLEKMEALSGDQLAETLDFRGVVQLPAVSFVQFTLNHTVHHRGQLSTYLRPMGAKVPSIYGESYDATQARLAKEAATS